MTIETEIITLSAEIRITYRSPEGRLAAIRLARRNLQIDVGSTECGGIAAVTVRGRE